LLICFINQEQQFRKNLAEADGSRDNLPPPAEAKEQFGLGIKENNQSIIKKFMLNNLKGEK
jgi:hypothetical protein